LLTRWVIFVKFLLGAALSPTERRFRVQLLKKFLRSWKCIYAWRNVYAVAYDNDFYWNESSISLY